MVEIDIRGLPDKLPHADFVNLDQLPGVSVSLGPVSGLQLLRTANRQPFENPLHCTPHESITNCAAGLDPQGFA